MLIDHVMVSPDLASGAGDHRVWNPYQDRPLAGLKGDLDRASDHFPVSLRLDLDLQS